MSDNGTKSDPVVSQTQTTQSTTSLACPYHGPIIRLENAYRNGVGQMNPMDRFLSEGSNEQSALYRRSDTGMLSTSKNCTCYQQVRGN